jgi:hypothetical protein
VAIRTIESDIGLLKDRLKGIKTAWDGRECVLEMKEADYNWRQMEWWGFYFELLCRRILVSDFEIPGERIGTVQFDMKGAVNWDMKAKAIKSDEHKCILNDSAAIAASVEKYGCHGVLIALCDVEYNDLDRSFQSWHSELKGGLSAYEKLRRARTSVSRYRKTRADLADLLFVRIDADAIERLDVMKQGRNSNGKPRPVKFMLDLESMDDLIVDQISFGQC